MRAQGSVKQKKNKISNDLYIKTADKDTHLLPGEKDANASKRKLLHRP